jgi:hypothetical protein
MRMFDYEKAAQAAGLSQGQLEELCRLVREEFPHDEMMYELHVLRACMAIQEGYLTIDEALAPDEPRPAVTPVPRERTPS